MSESAGFDGPQADEADLAEQQQGMDGSGTVTPAEVGPDEANEADVLEQGDHVTDDPA
ncbi:hypothetical protein QWY28_20490 [Nocardioides sp. SOB77]|uniref:Uncharacterized protein n=1 Tax=Nocardioides oceani TaxID=3058369 RepID=A0ABT8FKZ9_9ACTN|nr:hypothetical protein [Nocardioides oceani]MDN4175356.1 hypothetical protein [Nocardioides oceani]